MKKGLIFVLGILSFLGINTVSADTIDFNISSSDYYFNDISNKEVITSILENKFNDVIDDILKKNNHTHYIMRISVSGDLEPYFAVYSYDTSFTEYSSLITYSKTHNITVTYYFLQPDNVSYRIAVESYPLTNPSTSPFVFDMYSSEYYPFNFYLSNMDIYYDMSDVANIYVGEELLFNLKRNEFIPTYKEIIKLSSDFYTTIDLNNYLYVILTLKDYTPRDTFTTTMYVKGQLCPTTLYNYGSEEKKDYISGWQSPNCGTYYENFNRHLNYIRSEDITNHAIYYLTTYDKSKPNQIMLDPSVYNITYITSENENNPSVVINGKNYNTIPYSDLTDTSINTEINGINPTWSCAKYDTECMMDSSGINIENLFSNPLETLRTIWDVITSTFKLVTEFISLLPQTLQAFLYLAFAVGIALGIIKIIL